MSSTYAMSATFPRRVERGEFAQLLMRKTTQRFTFLRKIFDLK